jgi:hypothetical protein
MGAATQMGDPPAADHTGWALVLVVVEYHHPSAGEMKLLDGTKAHAIQAAHDHVIDPVPA